MGSGYKMAMDLSPAVSSQFKALMAVAAEFFVDGGYLAAPAPPLPVIQGHQRLVRPVQIVGQKRHLLVEALLGVERHPPGALEGQRALLWAGDALPGEGVLLLRLRRENPPNGEPLVLLTSPL